MQRYAVIIFVLGRIKDIFGKNGSAFVKTKDAFRKFKDVLHDPRKSFLCFAGLVLAVFLYAWTFGHGNTFVSWIRAKVEIVSMNRQIREYEEKTREMDARINDLKTNRDSLEKFAREKFFFSAPDEDVYVVGE